MRLVELQQGQPLEELLPALIRKYETLKDAADSVDIGEATLWRWVVLFGLRTQHMEEKERQRRERERRRKNR